MAEPELLLLDEPLSNLDAKLRESMRFEIKEIQTKLGITVVYVTHDQTEAMAMSDRIIVINRGVIQQIGSPEDIYKRPANQFVADFVGKVDFLHVNAQGGRLKFTDIDQSMPYTGDKNGSLVLALRPENIKIGKASSYNAAADCLKGKLTTCFYLGDVYDCRVDLGHGNLLRVITDAATFEEVKVGDEVALHIREYLLFENTDTADQLKIMT